MKLNFIVIEHLTFTLKQNNLSDHKFITLLQKNSLFVVQNVKKKVLYFFSKCYCHFENQDALNSFTSIIRFN